MMRRKRVGGVKACFCCKRSEDPSGMVTCKQCLQPFHKHCLELPRKSCLTGWIPQCGDCAVFELKILDIDAQEEAKELHKAGLQAAENCVAEGTMGNYVSYLFGKGASVANFANEVLNLEQEEILPKGDGEGMSVTALGMYVVWASKRLATSSLGNYVNAVAKWHEMKGIRKEEWPTEHHSIKARLKGIKRERGVSDGGRGPKAPISIGLLGAMCAFWEERAAKAPEVALLCYKQVALLLTGFFGFLRGAELAALKVGDVKVFDWGVEVRIRKSKADQYKKGCTVRIAAVTASGFHVGEAVARYKGVLEAAGRGGEEPLFPKWVDGRLTSTAMAKAGVSAVIRDTLQHVQDATGGLLGFLDRKLFAGHSLRRGGLNAGRRAGNTRHQSKLHGRWRSDAIEAYDELGLDEQLEYTQAM